MCDIKWYSSAIPIKTWSIARRGSSKRVAKGVLIPFHAWSLEKFTRHPYEREKQISLLVHKVSGILGFSRNGTKNSRVSFISESESRPRCCVKELQITLAFLKNSRVTYKPFATLIKVGLLNVDIDIRMLLFLPFNPLEWQTNNFSLPFHFWIKYNDHEIKERDHQLKKFLVVEHIILVSTIGNIKRTVYRMWIIILT